MSYESVQVSKSKDVHVMGAERRFVSERSDRGVAPVHFSNQNNPGKGFETTPPVSGDILNSDSGREDPNSMRGYRDAGFEIPLVCANGVSSGVCPCIYCRPHRWLSYLSRNHSTVGK